MKQMIALCICTVALAASCSQDRPPNVVPSVEPAATALPQAAPAPVSTAARYLDAPPQWLSSAAPSEQLSCFLDVVQSKEREGKDEVQLLGWSVDKTGATGVAQKDAFIRIRRVGGNTYFFPTVRSPRPDVEVAPEFSSLGATNSGVASNISLTGVEPGSYEIAFVVGDDADASTCSFGSDRILVVSR